MGQYRSFKCENCNAMLRVDGDRKYVFCEYCGTQNILDGGFGYDFDEDDDYDDEDRGYRGPYDKELELERMRQKEREEIRDNHMVYAVFGFLGLMILLGTVFGL